MTEVTIKTPGRVCLLGDKNDMRNGPVIAAAISKFFSFRMKKIDGKLLKFTWVPENKYFERSIDENSTDSFFKFLSAISWRLKDKISPFEVFIDGDLPIGSGLSSSAACSVGFIECLNKLFSLGMSTEDIAELAYVVEHNDLGIMCGRMDQYSIAFGGITFIDTGDETKVIKMEIESLPLVIGNSCEPRMAMEVLNRTMEKLEQNDPHFISCFDRINLNVEHGLEAIARGDFVTLGKCMNVHQSIEREMKASTPKLDAMCEAALKSGALGAKQIGAGGGGCMIALCTPENIDNVMKAIQDVGAQAWKADIFKVD